MSIANPSVTDGRHNANHNSYQPSGYATTRNTGKHTSGDVFRPNLLALPKDPFASRSWVVDVDALPLPIPSDPNDITTRRKHIILILGTPPLNDLHAFVYSTLLQDSLVLIATHDVRPFASLLLLNPSSDAARFRGPTTWVLRLSSPLFSTTSSVANAPASSLSLATGGGSDALRLMSLFNRASQLAASEVLADAGGANPSMRIQQFSEHPTTGAFTIAEVLGSTSPASNTLSAGASRRTMGSPSLSQEQFNAPRKSKRQTLTNFFGFNSHKSLQATSNSSTAMGGASGAGGGKRSFDALVNYLASSSAVPEKVLLKQAILVTTLSAPYISNKSSGSENIPPSLLPSSSHRSSKTTKRASVLGLPLSRRRTLMKSPNEPSPDQGFEAWKLLRTVKRYSGPSHIIHAIADTNPTPSRNRDRASSNSSKPQLAASIEQFVLAFAFPIGLSFHSSPSTPIASGRNSPRRVSQSKSSPMISNMGHPPTPSSSSDSTPRHADKRNLFPNVLVRETESGPYAGFNADPNNGGRPIPYLTRGGVLGGIFSFSYSADGRPGVQSISVADLILLGALDQSVAEHGGGKAWLGGVGVKEIVDGLVGRIRPGLEIRNSGAKVVMENIWIGGDVEGLHRAPGGKSKDRALPPPAVPPKDELGPPTSNKVSRKPAPFIPPSESLTAAWQEIAPAAVAREKLEEQRRREEEEREQRRQEKEMQKARERDMEIERQRQQAQALELQRAREAELEGEREQQLERERKLERERQRDRERALDLERERERERVESERQRQRQLEREVERERESQWEREQAKERIRQREFERERERIKERGREREKERAREGDLEHTSSRKERDTGLLTPPGSGSEIEIELQNGLDSPVRDTQGLSAAMLGVAEKHQRPERRRSENTRTRNEDRNTSRRPDLIRGYSEGTSNIPPSGSTESARKAANESFDIVPFYEYDRSKCEKKDRRRDTDRERDRDYERGSRDHRERTDSGRERERERERGYERASNEHDRERSRDPEHHRDRERERDRSRRRERERERERGVAGPPPARSAYHRKDDDRRSQRTSSSRHRHDYDPEEEREGERRRRGTSHRRTTPAAPPDQAKEVYYYSLSGEVVGRPTGLPVADAQEYANTFRDRGDDPALCALVGVPPNVGYRDERDAHSRYREGGDEGSTRERKESRSPSKNYHYKKGNSDNGHSNRSDRGHYDAPSHSKGGRIGDFVGKVLGGSASSSPVSSMQQRRLSIVAPVVG